MSKCTLCFTDLLNGMISLKFIILNFIHHCPRMRTHYCYCYCQVTSVVSDSVRPHRWQPTRVPRPWDSPGNNTGVGCHFLLQCMKVKSEVKSLSCVRLLATPWTAACQAPPSIGFSRQEYWSGCHCLLWRTH